jgi:ribulose-phosphate 3-epimerase
VDGGISESTIQIAAESGANCFVAGSAVYKSKDPAQMILTLRKLALEGSNF